MVHSCLFKLNETFMKHFVLYTTLGSSDILPLDEYPTTISVTATKWSSRKQAHDCKDAEVTRAQRRGSGVMAAIRCVFMSERLFPQGEGIGLHSAFKA